MSDAFLAEHDVHFVRDADFVSDVRRPRVIGTHRITYHSVAASPITYLQIVLFYDIKLISELFHIFR